MNKILIIGLLILALLSSGCTTKMSTYTQEGTDNRIELRANDHFFVHQVDGFSGLWCIDGDELKLHPIGGETYVLIADGKDYIDGDGDRWVKK